MSTTPSQFAPALVPRRGQASAAPNAASSTNTTKTTNTAPASSSNKTRKGTRKSRLHKEIKELNKAKKELWKSYITEKFQALYTQHLTRFRLEDDDVQHKTAKEKRALLRSMDGYNEALDAFRRDKEVFIQGLVALSRLEGGALAIDDQAATFLGEHE